MFRWNQNGILVPLAGTPQEFRWRGGADGTPDLGAFPRPPGGAFFRRGGASRRPDYELIQEHPGKHTPESDFWPAGGELIQEHPRKHIAESDFWPAGGN